MILLAFPCDIHVATRFVKRVDITTNTVAVILDKQESIRKLLVSMGCKNIIALKEDTYGKATTDDTKKLFKRISKLDIERANFPIIDFQSNIALFLSLFTNKISAVNTMENFKIDLDLDNFTYDPTEFPVLGGQFPSIQEKISEKLSEFSAEINRLNSGERDGERDSLGLLHDAPSAYEGLSKYIYLSQKIKGRVLDIGCGGGYGAYAVGELNKDCMISAIDYDSATIATANKLWGSKKLKFKNAHVERITYGDNYFDFIICFDVIEHIDKPQALLNECYRLLRPGGRLIGSTPNSRKFFYNVNKDKSKKPLGELQDAGIWKWHIQEFDEGQLKYGLINAGFKFPRFEYPTFTKGLDLLRQMVTLDFEKKVDYLSRNLDWSWTFTDFNVSNKNYPLFSSSSFMFEAHKAELENNK